MTTIHAHTHTVVFRDVIQYGGYYMPSARSELVFTVAAGQVRLQYSAKSNGAASHKRSVANSLRACVVHLLAHYAA
jgi:hypothetical protein